MGQKKIHIYGKNYWLDRIETTNQGYGGWTFAAVECDNVARKLNDKKLINNGMWMTTYPIL